MGIMTEVSITEAPTTTKTHSAAWRGSPTTVLLRVTVRGAWALISSGERWYAALDSLPVVQAPAVLWRISRRAVAAGEALEVWAERTAERLGIDILEVLAPLTDGEVLHGAA
jgi:hypothetical protein